MKARFVLCAFFALLVTACSFEYEIRAVQRDDRISFEPGNGQGTGCLSSLSVATADGETMWRIGADRHLSHPCHDKFPIIYGAIPQGMTEGVRARPLSRGMVYRIEAWDGDSYRGTFWLTPAGEIENLPTNDRSR